jgi:hypothetical protein
MTALVNVIPDFFGPSTSVSSNPDILKEAVIAETFRLAISSLSQEAPEARNGIHTNTLRSWIVKKIRSLIPEIAEARYLEQVIREGKGPTLEFIGDVIVLPRGYFIPTRTRAIPIANGRYGIVSAKPTRRFSEEGFKMEVNGMIRVFTDTTDTILEQSDIPIQSRESYIGGHSKGDIIEYFINQSPRNEWCRGTGWEAYIGQHPGQYDFVWGDRPLAIKKGDGYVSLWREPREFNSFAYWLCYQGQGWKYAIHVPNKEVRLACLSLDTQGGLPRKAEIIVKGDVAEVRINFPPPGSTLRWLYISGGRWKGFRAPYICWEVPSTSISGIKDELHQIGVSINIEGTI